MSEPEGFQVQRVRCKTCIYRKDTHFDLDRLEGQVKDDHMDGFFKGYRACHHAKSGRVCCRGFWDHHKDNFTTGQLAQRLDAVVYVDVDDPESWD